MLDKELEIEDLTADQLAILRRDGGIEIEGQRYKVALDFEVKVKRNDGTVEVY